MSLKIGRNDPCWCGSGKKYKKCHEAFDEKMEIMKQKGYAVIDHDLIKTPEQIAKIKESCKINIAVLDYVEEHIKPGVSTEEIDRWVHEETVRHGGIPAPLNYEGKREILSMLMYLQYIMVIILTRPECSASVK